MRLNTLLFLILCCCCFFTFKSFSSNPNLIDDHIFINCGSSSTALTGRQWLGDTHPNFTLQGSSSTRSTLSVDPVPYNTARISRSQFSYSFQLNPGQKYIRLLFNPTSYNDFKRFDDFFTVEAGPFTLLSNFSASVTADALAVTTFAKEFCLSVHENQSFNIVFSPSTQHTHAFINGIEIISVPSSLDYCHGGDIGIRVVGHKSVIYIDNTTALEMVSRQNIKRGSVPLGDDIRAMFGMWAGIRKQKAINQASNITWNVSVDVGFRYLIRLHFCEIGLKMAETAHKDFIILINHTIATTSAEIIQKREDQGTLWYKNYMVMVNGHKREGKRDIFISLHSKDEILDRHVPLEGFEIFKLSNHDNSLSSPTPLPTTRDSPPHTIQILLSVLGRRNAIATVIIAIVSLVNIVFHLLLKILGDDFHEEENKPSTRAKRLCRRFSLAEIQSATDNFNDAFVIGRGGFGKVYKGRIDKGKETVAIKRLKPNSKQGTREFWTEIETLSELRHVNLVSLIGYCNEDPEMILVYEYMPCGSLADHLYKLARKSDDCSSLSWKERLQICIGAGRGIDYLHTGHRFIHRDIKASNILLDENFVAKVSDFGLAKIESGSELQSQGSTNLKGTFGYIDPNYFRTHRITTKSDTYSFGVVLLEVLCGRPAVEPWVEEDKRSLSMWALENISKGEVDQVVAPSLRGEILPDSLMTFVRITERCLHDKPKKRPAMVHVVINLEFALEQQAKAKSLVPNEITSIADFFPFSGKVLQENANSLGPNEITDVADILPQQENVNPMVPNVKTIFGDAFPCTDRTLVSVSTRQLTTASSIMQNETSPLTERINSKTSNAGTRDGIKTTMQKLSRRLWPWDAFRKTAKPSRKKEPGNIYISAPILRRTGNMTSRVSTFPEKRVAGTNEVKFTPSLVRKEITGVADFFPFPDKAQQENEDFLVSNEITDVAEVLPQQDNANSLVPNEITNVGDALPCTDRSLISLSTRQLTMAASIMQNGTSPLTEQMNSKTFNAGTNDALKTTTHKLLQRLWPWDAFRKTIKSSKKKDPGNILISAPISRKTKNMTSRASTSPKKIVAGSNGMISTPKLKIFSFAELKDTTRNFRSDTVLGEGGFGRVYQAWREEKHSGFSAASGGDEVCMSPNGQMLAHPNIRAFSFSELKVATRNFRNDTVLGEGGFGKVYKGWLNAKSTAKGGTGSAIAVKKLNSESMQGFQEWQSEVNFLGRLSHPNLVKLLGYCWEDKELLLVYEFMPKGSLENHLFGRGSSVQPLPWDIRLKILIGAARGMAFLHASDRQVIYRDFKPSNILLDGSYNAKMSDFGLAKMGPTASRSHVTTQVMGTYGYAAPEYVATGHLYVKSDVYGFGVVLVEMLTGLRALNQNRPSGQHNLVEWIKPHLLKMNKLKMVMDSRLEERYPAPSALKIAQLAVTCLESEPRKRPSMKEVVEALEKVDSTVEKPRQTRVQFRDLPAR